MENLLKETEHEARKRRALDLVQPRFTQLVDAQGDTMTGAPHDKRPGSTVPQAS